MPIYKITNPDTGESKKIKADRAPSQEEAVEYFSSSTTTPQAEAPEVSPNAEYEAFKESYLQEAQQNPLEKAISLGSLGPKAILGVLGTAKEGVEGLGEMAGEASTKGVKAPLEFQGNLTQSAIEGAGRGTFDLLNLIRQSVSQAQTRPDVIGKLLTGGPMGAAIQFLKSRTPSEDEIQQAYLEQQKNQDFQTIRNQPMAPEVFGEANPKVAEAASLALDPSTPLTIGAGMGAKSLVKATAPALEKAGVKRSAETIATSLLKTGSEGETRQLAQSFLKGEASKPFQLIKELGGKFEDAPTFIQSGYKALEPLGSKIKTFAQKLDQTFDLNDAADAMVKSVAEDPLISTRDPDVILAIQNNADQLRKITSAQELLDWQNAINKRHQNYFSQTEKGQATRLLDAEFATDEIARQFISRKLDDAFQSFYGAKKNPYRDYGKVTDAVSKIENKFYKEVVARQDQINKGVLADSAKKVQFTKPFTFAEPVAYLRGGELGKLNRDLGALVNKLPKIKSKELNEALSKIIPAGAGAAVEEN